MSRTKFIMHEEFLILFLVSSLHNEDSNTNKSALNQKQWTHDVSVVHSYFDFTIKNAKTHFSSSISIILMGFGTIF